MAETAPKVIHVCGVIGMGPHEGTGDLGMIVGLDDGTRAILRIKLDLLSGLSLAIRNHLAKATYTDEGGMIAAQPMQLNSCQPFAMQDGRVGMVMEIEHMRLPVAFPLEAVPTVINGLNRILELSSARPAGGVN